MHWAVLAGDPWLDPAWGSAPVGAEGDLRRRFRGTAIGGGRSAGPSGGLHKLLARGANLGLLGVIGLLGLLGGIDSGAAHGSLQAGVNSGTCLGLGGSRMPFRKILCLGSLPKT